MKYGIKNALAAALFIAAATQQTARADDFFDLTVLVGANNGTVNASMPSNSQASLGVGIGQNNGQANFTIVPVCELCATTGTTDAKITKYGVGVIEVGENNGEVNLGVPDRVSPGATLIGKIDNNNGTVNAVVKSGCLVGCSAVKQASTLSR